MTKDDILVILRERGGSATSGDIVEEMRKRFRIIQGGTRRQLERLRKGGDVTAEPVRDPKTGCPSTLWRIAGVP